MPTETAQAVKMNDAEILEIARRSMTNNSPVTLMVRQGGRQPIRVNFSSIVRITDTDIRGYSTDGGGLMPIKIKNIFRIDNTIPA